MFTWNNVKLLVVAVLAGSLLLLSVGCGWSPSEEQIRAMEETRSAALAAEQKAEELKQERGQLENDLSAAQNKADGAKADKEATQQRVDNWEGEE